MSLHANYLQLPNKSGSLVTGGSCTCRYLMPGSRNTALPTRQGVGDSGRRKVWWRPVRFSPSPPPLEFFLVQAKKTMSSSANIDSDYEESRHVTLFISFEIPQPSWLSSKAWKSFVDPRWSRRPSSVRGRLEGGALHTPPTPSSFLGNCITARMWREKEQLWFTV